MSGKAPRQKGDRFERAIVHAHRGAGLHAERIPLSGAVGGAFSGDLVVLNRLRAECKKRGNGFRSLYTWLDGNDMLFLGADRAEPLVVVPLSRWLELAVRIREALEEGE